MKTESPVQCGSPASAGPTVLALTGAIARAGAGWWRVLRSWRAGIVADNENILFRGSGFLLLRLPRVVALLPGDIQHDEFQHDARFLLTPPGATYHSPYVTLRCVRQRQRYERR